MTTLDEQVHAIRARINLLREERKTICNQVRSRREVSEYVHARTAEWAASFEQRARRNLRVVAGGRHVPLLGGDVSLSDIPCGDVDFGEVLSVVDRVVLNAPIRGVVERVEPHPQVLREIRGSRCVHDSDALLDGRPEGWHELVRDAATVRLR